MGDKGIFSISDFAKFSRTTRDTLLHYDKIGLLSPELRRANNYRYYSRGQLTQINVIRTLQRLGMTLEEIKNIKDNRTPALVNELFKRQIKKIDQTIEMWTQAQKLLYTLDNSIHSVSKIDEKAITIQFMPVEAIVLGDLNDYSRGRGDYDALLSFYRTINRKYPDLDLNYPVWGFFSEERIKRGDWVWPDRYYFYNHEGCDKKPAALYAIGYMRSDYGQGGELYRRIIDYIDNNGFEICGDAYEEYPLNEISITDSKDYLMRVMITVREKNTTDDDG